MTKVKFRPHRELLYDSMCECVEVESLAALTELLGRGLLYVAPYGWDERIGWDTHIVTNCDGVVGFTNGLLV